MARFHRETKKNQFLKERYKQTESTTKNSRLLAGAESIEMLIRTLRMSNIGEFRLPAAEAQFCRPVPRKPAFLMESLTREGLNTTISDEQLSQQLPTRYLLRLCIIQVIVIVVIVISQSTFKAI